jgi:hypothetical protein
MSTSKPLASLSLDLDNKWSYMKTHGDPGWKSLPSYLDILVPRVLRFLKERNLTITIFVVGLDAAQDGNRDLLRSITEAGHEVGNHSYHHEPWLHLYSREQLEAELDKAEQAIELATGSRPVGFRGPGFSFSADVIDVLIRRSYLYDASTLPTYLGPLARAYYFMQTRLSDQESEQRQKLFGNFSDGTRPAKAYCWQTDAGRLIEIPVTTMPGLKLPIHVSYLVYLPSFSPALAIAYFKTALRMCRITGTQPSLLLHPLDFLGCDDTTDLGFFPAMKMRGSVKCSFVGRVVDTYCEELKVVPLCQHARDMQKEKLSARAPDF